MKVSIPQFPLRLANVFTPEGTVGLEGFLRGQVAITGAMDAPLLNGELAFQDGKAEAAMIGTTFSIDSVPLVIKDNVLDFNRWGIIAPNKRRLEFGGNVDFTSFADIKMKDKGNEIMQRFLGQAYFDDMEADGLYYGPLPLKGPNKMQPPINERP